MARVPYEAVPTVQPRPTVPDRYQHIETNPEEFGGLKAQGEEALGAGMQKLGEGATQASSSGFDIAQFYGQIASDRAQGQLYDWLHQKMHGTGQVDPGTGQVDTGFLGLRGEAALHALPQINAEIAAKQKEILGTLPTRVAQHAFDVSSRRIMYYAQDRIGQWADEQRYTAAKSTNDDTYANGAKMVASDPDNPQALQLGLDMMRQGRFKNLTLDGLDKNNDAVTRTHQQTNVDYMETRINALAGQNAPRAAELLNVNRNELAGSPGFDELSARVDAGVFTHYEALGLQNLNAGYKQFQADRSKLAPPVQDRLDAWFQTRIERQQDHIAARTRVSLDRAFSDASAIVDSGQPATVALGKISDKQIDAAFPNDPDQAAELKERVGDLRAVSAFQEQIVGMTPPQLAALSAHIPQPDPNDPGTYRFRQAMNRALDAARTNTAKALAADPAAYVVKSYPNIAALGAAADKDPAKFPAYATATLGIQTQMGVPEASRFVLPKQTAQQMAQGIMADPSGAPAKLRKMEQTYGSYWPLVWRDLSSVKGGLPPAYQAVAVLDNLADGALLARWMSETGKDQKTADDLLGTKAVSDIQASVRGDTNGVGALTSSLARSGSSATQIAGVLDAIDDLAFAKAFYNRDPNAAQSAIDSFTSKYEFMPNGGARVPANRFDDVSANAEATLSALVGATGSEGSTFAPGEILRRNSPYVAPGAGDNFNTNLSASDEGKFRAWVKDHNVPFDVDTKTPDYDMRGFWQALQSGDPRATQAVDPNDGRMHFPDYWKTPYDLTFSRESKWATQGAPEWNDKDQLVLPSGKVVFDDRNRAPYLGSGKVIAVPPIYGQPGQPTPEEYLGLLQASPTWITSPKADALWLMDPMGRVVRTKKGDPVSVPFDAVAPVTRGSIPDLSLGEGLP